MGRWRNLTRSSGTHELSIRSRANVAQYDSAILSRLRVDLRWGWAHTFIALLRGIARAGIGAVEETYGRLRLLNRLIVHGLPPRPRHDQKREALRRTLAK